ncbi:MAG: TIGR02996 domain-containing protein [Kofleriaceae bacterium]
MIGRWLVELVVRARHRPDRGCFLTSHDFWFAVGKLLADQAHAGLADAVAGIELDFTALARVEVRASVREGIAAIHRATTPPVDDEDALVALEATLAAGTRAVVAAGRTGAELLAEIYADPTADGPRAVYADWLIERGDPRGAFIVMQLERAPRARPAELELVAAHGEAWMGPLAPVVRRQGVVFARGFLAAARVHFPSSELAESLRDAREWSTLEGLELENDVGVLPAPVTALRRLSGLHRSKLDVLGRPADFPALEHLGIRFDDVREAIERCPGFPALRSLDSIGVRLGFEPASLRWLWSTPLGQVDRFSIGSEPASLARWLAEDATHRMPIRELEVTSTRWSNVGPGFQLVMTRDASGALSRLAVVHGRYKLPTPAAPPLDELCDALVAVPRGLLSHVTIVNSRTLRASPDAIERFVRVAELGGFTTQVPW